MGLTENSDGNLIPCGFRTDGKIRKVKQTCLISRMKNLCMLKGTTPQIAVCITMYNEDENLFKMTLRGVLQNYNTMNMDPSLKLK